MPRIRILQGVSGDGFSWIAGDVVDLPEAEAAKWADGDRAERIDPPPAGRPPRAARADNGTDAGTDETVDDDAPSTAEKAVPRSRGGGRGRRTETR
ncbi:hypothetical protein [Streptomyces xanthophaeus]|uniref:hypothetical protein n=1 Tax=Streptomyces xanthophaeus TaxID=67385 RepID=UPI003661B7BF